MWTISYEKLIESCNNRIAELERKLEKVKEDKRFWKERLKESDD